MIDDDEEINTVDGVELERLWIYFQWFYRLRT